MRVEPLACAACVRCNAACCVVDPVKCHHPLVITRWSLPAYPLPSAQAACVIALVFGVLFAAPAFTELLLAWLAALLFTWLVIEPSEVLALVLLPSITKSKRLMACRATCKDLGFV